MNTKTRLLFFFGLFLSTFLSVAHASIQQDTISFADQRARINNLLDSRKERFGEFDRSLQMKSGIFGIFKTSADMQHSIDILKQVIVADNQIFVETKRLLDIKDYESARYEALAKEYDAQVTAHMKTISKLQNENDKLRAQINELGDDQGHSNLALYIALAVIAFLLFTRYQAYKRQQIKKLTQQ